MHSDPRFRLCKASICKCIRLEKEKSTGPIVGDFTLQGALNLIFKPMQLITA